MKKYRVIYLLISLVFIWFTFVWCRYQMFYINYTQAEINEIFKESDIPPPVYDSINVKGYKVYYLTNKKNYSMKRDNFGYRKPYLFLSHDSGLNSSYFIDYFKNKQLNRLFHIIAVDRIGFGKTHLKFVNKGDDNNVSKSKVEEFGEQHSYANCILQERVLDEELKYLEEIRTITTGESAILALEFYTESHSSAVKQFMFQPKLKPRYTISKYFSKIISRYIYYIFPKPYVNKHKDLLFIDKLKEEKIKYLIDFAKGGEDAVNERNPKEYYPKGTFRSIFVGTDSNSEKKYLEKLVDSKNHFIIKKMEGEDVYHSPNYYLKHILKADDYTFEYQKVQKVGYQPMYESIDIE